MGMEPPEDIGNQGSNYERYNDGSHFGAAGFGKLSGAVSTFMSVWALYVQGARHMEKESVLALLFALDFLKASVFVTITAMTRTQTSVQMSFDVLKYPFALRSTLI